MRRRRRRRKRRRRSNIPKTTLSGSLRKSSYKAT